MYFFFLSAYIVSWPFPLFLSTCSWSNLCQVCSAWLCTDFRLLCSFESTVLCILINLCTRILIPERRAAHGQVQTTSLRTPHLSFIPIHYCPTPSVCERYDTLCEFNDMPYVQEFDSEGREFNHSANTGRFCTPGLTQRNFNEGECQTELSFSMIK